MRQVMVSLLTWCTVCLPVLLALVLAAKWPEPTKKHAWATTGVLVGAFALGWAVNQ